MRKPLIAPVVTYQVVRLAIEVCDELCDRAWPSAFAGVWQLAGVWPWLVGPLARAPASLVCARHKGGPQECAPGSCSACAGAVLMATISAGRGQIAPLEEGCTPPGRSLAAIFGSVGAHGFRCARFCARFGAQLLLSAA